MVEGLGTRVAFHYSSGSKECAHIQYFVYQYYTLFFLLKYLGELSFNKFTKTKTSLMIQRIFIKIFIDST